MIGPERHHEREQLLGQVGRRLARGLLEAAGLQLVGLVPWVSL